MSRSTIAGIVMFLLLVATNAWWLSRMADFGVLLSDTATIANERQAALDQSTAVIAAMAANADRAGIIDAARTALPGSEPIEKGDDVWIGQLRLKFGPDNRLIEAGRGVPLK